MANERSIAKGLSGGEALDSLIRRVYEKLRLHGHFNSFKSYSGYKAKVTVEFTPRLGFVPPLVDEIVVDEGEGKEGLRITEVIEIPVMPPNKVREECEMDQPVQVEIGGVPVERWIKPSQYKGKLKGATRHSNMGMPGAPNRSPIDSGVADQYGMQSRSDGNQKAD